jgi:hypothetical protein
MAEPPDGFTEFVAVRSATPLRSAWLLTADAGKAEDLLQTVLGHDHRHHAIGDVADEMADRDALKRHWRGCPRNSAPSSCCAT